MRKANDSPVFVEMYTTYKPELVKKIRSLGRFILMDDDDIESAAGEAFVALENELRNNPGIDIAGWLFSTTANKLTDIYRGRYGRTGQKKMREVSLNNLSSFEGPEYGELFSVPSDDLGKKMDMHQLRETIRRILDDNGNKQWAKAFRMLFLEGKSRQEIATTLEKTPNAIDLLLLYAMKKIEEIIPNLESYNYE